MNIINRLKKLIKNSLLIIGVIILGLLLRIFVIEIYYIPSSSMENTLFEGDIILVNKLHYGALIPFSQSKRILGYSDIKRRDVFVFEEESNSIFTNGKVYIKRCIGLPDDKITIDNNKVFINGIAEDASELKLKNKKELQQKFILNEFEVGYLNDKCTSRIIPYKGQSILIDSIDIKTCRKVLYRDSKTQNPFKLLNKQYNFHHDFYFMMGDNRQHSYDSRTFGPISKHQIIGKAVWVLFSWDKTKKGFSKIKFDRIFKRIN